MKLYSVTFYKKWTQEIETIENIVADTEDDTIGLLIDLDNNSDECLGLEELEYSINEI